jgi:hypothetical protein
MIDRALFLCISFFFILDSLNNFPFYPSFLSLNIARPPSHISLTFVTMQSVAGRITIISTLFFYPSRYSPCFRILIFSTLDLHLYIPHFLALSEADNGILIFILCCVLLLSSNHLTTIPSNYPASLTSPLTFVLPPSCLSLCALAHVFTLSSLCTFSVS